MKHAVLTAALAALVALPATNDDRVFAQPASGQQDALRQQIEQRFDVVPLQDSVLLRPKAGDRRVRSIEVTDESIIVDGVPATGAELRSKLGADADLVLRLSYLDRETRRQLAGSAAAPAQDRSIEPPAERPEAQSSPSDESR